MTLFLPLFPDAGNTTYSWTALKVLTKCILRKTASFFPSQEWEVPDAVLLPVTWCTNQEWQQLTKCWKSSGLQSTEPVGNKQNDGSDTSKIYTQTRNWAILAEILWISHSLYRIILQLFIGFGGLPDSSVGKESACNAGYPDLLPGLGRSTERTGYPLQYSWASPVPQLGKNPPAKQKSWVLSLGWEDPLEKGKTIHPSILA